MDTERPPNLRAPGTEPGSATPPGGAGLGGTPPPINALAELVADLIAATGLVPADKLAMVRGRGRDGARSPTRSSSRTSPRAKGLARDPRRPLPDAARRPRPHGRHRGGGRRDRRCTSSSASPRSRTRSRTARSGSRSPTPATSRGSTSCGSRRATRSSSASPRARTSSRELRRLARASEAFGARAAVEDELALESRRRTRPTTSRPTTASPTRRSSGSSTP